MASGMYMGKVDGVHDTKYVCIFILYRSKHMNSLSERE